MPSTRIQGKSLIPFFLLTLLGLTVQPALAVINPTDLLTAADGASQDEFGRAVAIDGNTAIVGAYRDDVVDGVNFNVVDAGSAYIYVNDGNGNWTQQAKLTAEVFDSFINDPATTLPFTDLQRSSGFGYSVAISGNTAVVGAPFYDIEQDGDANDNKDILDAGAIYIFQRDETGTWNPVTRFTIVEEDAQNGDWLGNAVDIHDDTIVAGALSLTSTGQAYIFFRQADGSWVHQLAQNANTAQGISEGVNALSPIDPSTEDWFGQAVAVHGNTVVIGSNGSDNPDSGSGSAYVYTRDENANWNFQAKLLPQDALAFSNFGVSVDIDQNDVIVGADRADGSTAGDGFGAAYVFRRNFQGGWTQTAKLAASDGQAADKFGASVAIHEPLAVVGAWDEDSNGVQSGSAYLFQKAIDGTWSQVDIVRETAGTTFDNLGFDVGISSISGLADHWIIAGAPQIQTIGNGEVHVSASITNLIDSDGDTITNDTDTDHDNDSILNVNDAFPFDATAFSDIDGDGFGDAVDQFHTNSTESADTDGDGLGNNIDSDDDGDGISDEFEYILGTQPLVADSYDFSSDRIDFDSDGVVDSEDAFPNDPDETLDTDGDGLGNNADSDDDNDGLTDLEETNTTTVGDPLIYDPGFDTDPLNIDTDGDGTIDSLDAQPLNPAVDTDGDGIANDVDLDDDGDGIEDALDDNPTVASGGGGGSLSPAWLALLLLAGLLARRFGRGVRQP